MHLTKEKNTISTWSIRKISANKIAKDISRPLGLSYHSLGLPITNARFLLQQELTVLQW